MDAVMSRISNPLDSDELSPPDWRWQAARHVHERFLLSRRRTRKSDPGWLAPLVALTASLNPCTRPRRRCSWSRLSVTEALVSAHQLYESDSPCRWEVEARILAGQSDAEIAVSTGLSPALVATYEQTFFRVRDRRAAGDYILFGVIGYDPFGGFLEGDLRTLWAYFGYAAGPKVLELVMAVSRGRSLPDWALREAPSSAAAELLEIGIKVMLMACTGAMTPAKLRKLVVLRGQVADLSRRTVAWPSQTIDVGTQLEEETGLGTALDAEFASTPDPQNPDGPPDSEYAAVA